MNQFDDFLADILEDLETSEESFLTLQEQNDARAFDMYVRIREFRQIAQGMQAIALLPEEEKQSWIADHEGFVLDRMEQFMQETLGTINEIQLDGETLELSVELVSTMRDTISIVQSMMRHHKAA